MIILKNLTTQSCWLCPGQMRVQNFVAIARMTAEISGGKGRNPPPPPPDVSIVKKKKQPD